jgi:hypothetical protein
MGQQPREGVQVVTSNRDQMLVAARKAWRKYELSGSAEDFAAAQQATEAAKAIGISLAEIGRDQ